MLNSSFQKEEAMQPFTVSVIPYFGTLYAKSLTYFMFLIQARDLYENGGGTYNFKVFMYQ